MKNKLTNLLLASLLISSSISPVFAVSDVENAFDEKFSGNYATENKYSDSKENLEKVFEDKFKNTEDKQQNNTDKNKLNYTDNNTDNNVYKNKQVVVREQTPKIEYVTVPSGDSLNNYQGGVTNPNEDQVNTTQNEKSYNISIKLTNAEGAVVKGVSVELLDGDTSLGKAQSNDEGIVKLNNIKKGSYVMKILSVPETYRAGQMLEVQVNEEKQNAQMTFVVEYNKITLKNQTNAKTEYEIYDAYQDKLLTKAESKSNGELVLNKVKAGLYYFKSGNVKSANLTVNDKYENVTVTFSNSDAVITDDQTTIVRDGNKEGSSEKLIKTGINDKDNLNIKNVILGVFMLALTAFSIYNLTEIKKMKSKDK